MRQRMLKAQLDLSVPCPDTQDFQPCMGPGCSDEGEETPRASEWLAGPQEGTRLPGDAGPAHLVGLYPWWGTRTLTGVVGVLLGRSPISGSVPRTLSTGHVSRLRKDS